VASIDPAGNMTIDGDMDGLGCTWESGNFIDLNCNGLDVNGSSQLSGPVGIQTPPLPVFALDAAGSIHATSFPVSSDFRLKENVRPLTNVLDKLEKVRGVSFDWNETYEELGRSSGHREIGVIAQEVESVFPELVTKWGEKDYRAVDYSRLSAVLIEAVKEQRKQIEKLAKEIEKLKNQSRQARVDN
ncbi:MAG: tail fiber domain-containing protein, partial [candidate division Zixibacteria bacterium]|nr:tail fiber domain-containing protein [candidate division Zixibacteria bacterium]